MPNVSHSALHPPFLHVLHAEGCWPLCSIHGLPGPLASARFWPVGWIHWQEMGGEEETGSRCAFPTASLNGQYGLVCPLSNSQFLLSPQSLAPVIPLSPTSCRPGVGDGLLPTLSFRITLYHAQLWNYHLKFSFWYKDVTSVWKGHLQCSSNLLSY